MGPGFESLRAYRKAADMVYIGGILFVFLHTFPFFSCPLVQKSLFLQKMRWLYHEKKIITDIFSMPIACCESATQKLRCCSVFLSRILQWRPAFTPVLALRHGRMGNCYDHAAAQSRTLLEPTTFVGIYQRSGPRSYGNGNRPSHRPRRGRVHFRLVLVWRSPVHGNFALQRLSESQKPQQNEVLSYVGKPRCAESLGHKACERERKQCDMAGKGWQRRIWKDMPPQHRNVFQAARIL